MALSYVFVFLLAIILPISILGGLDALDVINIEELSFDKHEEFPPENNPSSFLARFPRGLFPFLLFSSVTGIVAGALVSRG